MKIRDRIKELRRVKSKDLLPNPKNWRTHPVQQMDALKAILADVGWADAALARETPEGLQLIDGHARTEVDAESEIPVLILDVNEEEADRILATHDPLTNMATTDRDALEDLLSNLEVKSEAMQMMLDDLAEINGIKPPDFSPVSADDQGRLDQKSMITCPECGHEF